jgi:hypothetical protein
MKKIAALAILFLFCLLFWNAFADPHGMHIDIDGASVDGPMQALLALLFAGGGLIIGALVLVFVGALLAVLFAGVGLLLTLALGLGALVLAALVSPLLLPLLIPGAIIWFFVSRARRNRLRQQAV